MGAWGMKPFENDTSLDFMADVFNEFSKEGTIRTFEQAFELASESFIEARDAEIFIAAISLLIDEKNDFVDLSNEEDIKQVNDIYNCDIQVFSEYIKNNIQIDHSKMIRLLEVILDENSSDLAELWYEAEDVEWAETVRNLIELLREQTS